MIENSLSGIVLAAQAFNPSIFTETWLAQNDIVSADDLVGVRVFSPEVAQFQTSEVKVLVIPPRMQILFSTLEVEGDFELPRKIAARTVELLPETPYEALGLNFDYFVSQPEGNEFGAYNRALLGGGDNKLVDEFASQDARFGRYFSKNYGEARLKLNITPVKTGPEKKDLIQFSFNFHHDLVEMKPLKPSEKLREWINTWGAVREYTQQLVEVGSELQERR
ncbi:MAG: hypothetical protein HQ592_03480 [Planctomycetes bacterium]|nr:hypothetical protein [Planctomycetota bacterium]